jgi:hypothetical protein
VYTELDDGFCPSEKLRAIEGDKIFGVIDMLCVGCNAMHQFVAIPFANE